jgi:alpha-tubulin suppressor-like RCC1 family protein
MSAEDCPAAHFCGLRSHTCVATVDAVVAGANHSCALHHDGQVSCWGLAEAISAGGPDVISANYVGGVKNARLLSAGHDLSCAVTTSKVHCWGDRAYDVKRDDGLALFPASALAVGAIYGCAATTDGTRCWGRNDQGQLARPLTFTDSAGAVLSSPGSVNLLAAGQAVMTHDGNDRLCAWGDNRSLQITSASDTGLYIQPVCGLLPDVVELAVGDVHACARHSDGTVVCWGERYYGQLGLGGDVTDDVPPYGTPALLPGPAVQVVAGVSHTCALIQGGQVVCFGLNRFGEVGPGANTTAEEVRTPVAVLGFSGAVVALGSGSSAHHTCAILDTGGVECWGNDESGQLGDGQSKLEMGRHSMGPVTVQF